MDTLQDTYRDEDDDLPPQPTNSILSDVNPDLTPNPVPNLPETFTLPPLPDPQPISDPIAADPLTETEEPRSEPRTLDPVVGDAIVGSESDVVGVSALPVTDPVAAGEPETELELLPAYPSTEPEEPRLEPMAVDTIAVTSMVVVDTVIESEESKNVPEPERELKPMGLEFAEREAAKVLALGLEEASSDSISEDNVEVLETSEKKAEETQEEDDVEEGGPDPALKKVKMVETGLDRMPVTNGNGTGSKKTLKKKSKSKNSNDVWTKTTSRKGKKKCKNFNGRNNVGNNVAVKAEDTVKITPLPRFLDKNDDSPEAKICLSKAYKAEKVELSEDRMSAGSCKGYRMVRATRGVSDGAWFFEIKVVCLGETGHTRLGWSTDKGDLQAPVGYDGFSFGYRDVDGSKVHKAFREKYGEEGYKEGDVIGCYISLPEGNSFAPKPPQLVWFKGQKYMCNDSKEDPPKSVPGSEISFFKNGVCQGVAFKDITGGCYYPAASMYTLPNQPNCMVKFNFGPDFECFPSDFEGRPIPRPMIEVPYRGHETRVENAVVDETKQ